MYYTDTDTLIPKYHLEPDALTGDPMFRLSKLDCSMDTFNTDYLVPQRKDYYFFALVRTGSSRHWIDMVQYTLKPNTFYFTVPNQVQLKEEAGPLNSVIIAFTAEFLAMEDNQALKQLPIIQNPYNGHELTLTPQDVLFLEDIINKIDVEHRSGNNWQHSMLMAYIKVMLIYLSRLYAKQLSSIAMIPDRVLLKRYLAKIEELFTQLHEVAAYADKLNISAGHLSQVVKEQSGKPAIAHIHERLILEAKRLLFHTGEPVKEIAFQLGFEDASYFNRFFKRNTSRTPMEYRLFSREMYH